LGLFWQKESSRISAGRGKSRTKITFFMISDYQGFKTKNGLITDMKNVPNRPFWMVKLPFYGLVREKGGFGDAGFQGV